MRFLTAAFAFALLVAWGAASPADAQARAQEKAQASAQSHAKFTQPKLKAFISAATKLGQVRQKWVTRIRKATSREEAVKLEKQARVEMIAAVKNTRNITVEEYNRIAQAAANDKNLRARLQALFHQSLVKKK